MKPDAAGNRPLDAAVEKLMCDPRVTMHMLSMPHKAPASSSVVSDKPSTGAPISNANHTGIRPKKKVRPGKRNRATPTPPEELKSCYQTTTDGKPICWAYNLSNGCSLSTTGQPPRCTKGVHMCSFCSVWGTLFRRARQHRGSKAATDSRPRKVKNHLPQQQRQQI